MELSFRICWSGVCVCVWEWCSTHRDSPVSLITSSLSCLVSSLEPPHCSADFSQQPRECKIPSPPSYHWITVSGGGGNCFLSGLLSVSAEGWWACVPSTHFTNLFVLHFQKWVCLCGLFELVLLSHFHLWESMSKLTHTLTPYKIRQMWSN